MIRRLRTDQSRMHLVMMLALTFTTGIIDAVGYLGLDRVFTANMTGNVVILGMALTGADGLPIVGPVVALAAFMFGAALGGGLLRRARTGWSGLSTTVFSVTGGLLFALGLSCFVVVPVENTPWAYTITGLLGAAMGLQAAAARRIAVADVTTVVVTSTIVGLASESKIAGGTGKNFPRRVLAVALILVGAGVGALLLQVHIGVGMGVAGGLTLLVALVGHLARERKPVGEKETVDA
ncbi:YoaK family protein [Frigoribacterium sp. 2-23]|uniref:YoaK family protein n=1 Tax=Frigoribacterium sp. 2-23 TaxID=3415006 RepID=UPI003C7044B9